MNTFSSSLSQSSAVITSLMTVIFVSVPVTSFIVYQKSAGDSATFFISSLITLLLMVILIALYLLQTTGIAIDNNKLIIERRIKPVVLDMADIRQATLVNRKDMGHVWRILGNGGLFGYTGQYQSKSQGRMTWYCTKMANYIVIEKTDNTKLVISPDNPQELLNAIHTSMALTHAGQ